MARRIRLLPLLLAVAACPAASPAAPPGWEKVAAEGEEAPTGEPFGRLSLPTRLADDGSVAFADAPAAVRLRPVPGTPVDPPRFALWRWSRAGGAQHLVTIEVPASAGGAWRGPELFANRAGDLAWREGYVPSLLACGEGEQREQAQDRFSVLPYGGAVTPIAATGAPASGAPALTVARLLPPVSFSPFRNDFPAPAIDAGGAVTFYAHTAEEPCFTDSRFASDLAPTLFAPDGAGGIALVARNGDPLPGVNDGTPVRLRAFERVAGPAGAVLLLSVRLDPVSGDPLANALLRWRPGAALETVVQPGVASAFAADTTLAGVGGLGVSASGRVALRAVAAADDGTSPDRDRLAIWTGDADGVSEAWPLTGAVPGGPEGAVFAQNGVDDWVWINDAGEVAFAAVLDFGGAEPVLGLFGPGAGGAPILRMTTGSTAPGDGRVFTWLGPLHLADDGTLLVESIVASPPNLSPETLWYLLPRDGPPRLLLRASDEIEIAPGDRRALRSRTLSYDAALTQIGVRVGRSGLEPTAIAVRAVPEPCASAAGGCAFAALALLASRSRVRKPIRTECRMHRSSAC